MAQATWEDLAAGRGCAFDLPRADVTAQWELVARLTASSWYLPANQMYRGHGVLVFDPRHATRLDELSTAEWHAYAADLHRVVTAIVCPRASRSAINGRKNGTWGEFETSTQMRTGEPYPRLREVDDCDYLMETRQRTWCRLGWCPGSRRTPSASAGSCSPRR